MSTIKKLNKSNGKKKIIGILLLALVIVLTSITLTLSETQPAKLLYLSIEKPYYEIGEKIIVIITAENLNNYELSVSSPKNLYKFQGEMKNNIDFYPKEEGTHVVELTDKLTNKLIDSLEFIVGTSKKEAPIPGPQPEVNQTNMTLENETNETENSNTSNTTNVGSSSGLILTDKYSYNLGELVTASVNLASAEQGNYKLYYEYEGFIQKYMGDFNEIKFVPQGIGMHYLVLKDNANNEVERHGFEIIEPAPSLTPPISPPVSTPPATGEETPPAIISPIASIGTAGQAPQFEDTTNKTLRLVSSKGLAERAIITAYDEQNKKINLSNINVTTATNATNNTSNISGIKSAELLEIIPESKLFKSMVLKKLLLNLSQNTSLGIDEIPFSKVNLGKNIGKKNVLKAFAIDASSLNFTNGTLTGTARGTELWKCKEWEFANQQCLGTWQKIMDLTPGQDYNIEISPDDPGYAETGVASINTKKPIYHPSETAEIIMVVLDTQGHLVSSADVSLVITAPDNTTTILGTGTGEIIETSRGIYETSYNNTALEGTYFLEVRATGNDVNNVNNTMLSFFTVQPYYEFDIIRETPVTTDPWQGAFTSSIRIISHTNTSIFNFTEALPGSFEINNKGGATVTTANNKAYLTWTNLNNNSVVSYSATPPFVTPELYELGPAFVNYVNDNNDQNVFYEARPWYLAVDPYQEDKLPDGDGNYALWTIAGSTPAATRWQSVDDPVGGADDGVTYIASPDDTSRNSFSFQNLGVVGVTINWVAITVRAQRSSGSGGSASLQIFYRQGGNNYHNANLQALSTSWANYSLAGWNYTTNPATGAAWTESEINGMEWGVRRNSSTSSRLAWVTQMYVTVNYEITNNAPNVTALNYPGNNTNTTNSSTIPFNFTVTDDRGFNNCTLYTNVTGSWAPNASITTIQNNSVNNINATMPDGFFIWNVLCWDNITPSLSGWYTYNYTLRVDNTGPNVTLNQPVNFTNISANSYQVNATATDLTAVSTVTFLYRQNTSDTWHPACTNNSATGSSYTCTWNTASLSDGKTYEIRVYANDSWGHVGSNDTHANITIDRTGPNVTLNQPVNFTNITTNSYTLNATANDTMTAVNTVTFLYRQNTTDTWHPACINNSATTTTYICSWNTASLPDGKTYEIRTYANDTLGNIGNNDTHTNITIDRTGPNVTLNQPVNFTNITTTTYTLNATANDTITSVNTVTFLYRQNSTTSWIAACTNNSATGTTYTCNWNLAGLNDSLYYEVRAYANDTFGNIGNNDTHTNITVDLNGPTNTLNNPANFTNITSSTYTLNASESDISGISTVTFLYRQNTSDTWHPACTNNSATTTTYTCNWDLTSLPEKKTYEIRVYANDSWGHIGSNDTHTNITIDRTGPNVTINQPVNFTNITTNTYTVNATATDLTAVSTVTFLYRQNTSDTWHTACTNNSATTTTYTCTWNLAALPDGNTYEIRTYANDTLGNTGNNDTHTNITADRTGPNVTINQPTNFTNINNSTYTLNATATDQTGVSTVTFLYRPNATASWSTACSNATGGPSYICNWNVGGLASGTTYEVRAYANDTLGQNGANDTRYNITIFIPPPILENISCFATGIGWINCTNLAYGNVLDSVRADCAPNGTGTVRNVSFALTNIQDNNTYFNVTTSSTTGGHWEDNISNLVMYDSGDFNLHVTCRQNPTTEQDVNWSIPFGTLTATLVSPNTSINVTRNLFFNFTTTVTCTGGKCGYLNATLDPATTWWNYTYQDRRLINITNVDTSTLTQNYSILITVDTTTSDFQTNGNDLRIVYWNGTAYRELDRYNATSLNNANTKIWFRLQNSIASGSYDDNYYMYYNNSAASTPPNNGSNVFEFFDDFNRTDSETVGNGWTETSGLWNISGGRVLNRNGGDSDLTRTTVTNNHSIRAIANHNVTDADWKLVGRKPAASQGYSYGYQNNQMQMGSAAHDGYNLGTAAYTPTAGENHELELNMYGSTLLGYRDGTLIFNVSDTTYANGTMLLHAWDFAAFDDVWTRKFILNEPTAELGSTENYYAYKGMVSTIVGDVPFYTTSPNPQLSNFTACLANMTAGQSCNNTWQVNATGVAGTTAEFYSIYAPLNYSANVSQNQTSHINVTIINNIAPTVSNVFIVPSNPSASMNLNCTFTVTDPSYFDTLSANITWYKSGVQMYSQNMSVANGVQTFSTLSYTNLTQGDVWHCGVTPRDQSAAGSQVNSTTVTIQASLPPIINSVQCQENGTTWENCSYIAYNDNLTAVRVNCTDPDGFILNSSFNLTNIEDAKQLFSGNTTDNTTMPGYFLYNNSDITMRDSGNFNLTTLCRDNSNSTASSIYSWFIPFGTLTATLVSPNTSINVTRNLFFNFTTTVTCTGGECGYLNATLDPWENSNFTFRTGVSLTEPQNFARTKEHVLMNFTIASGRLPATSENTTVMYCNGVQVPWDAYAFTTSGGWITVLQGLAEINFTAGQTKTCYVYYDNDYNGTELAMTQTGWDYVGTFAGTGNDPPDHITPGTQNCFGISSNGRFNRGGICAGDPTIDDGAVNEWCYFKGQITGSESFRVSATPDQWNYMIKDGTTVASCQYATAGCSGTSSTTAGRYYGLEFDGSDSCCTGPAVLPAYSSTEQNLDTECYPYFGDEWLITQSYGTEEMGGTKGKISTVVGDVPFYTTSPNPQLSNFTACLANMTAGQSCNNTWQVNATGTAGSVFEFFGIYASLNYSNMSQGQTSHINITIINNTAPTASNVTLVPALPIDSENLNCSFIITDPSYFDTLSANVSWYRNNAYYSSSLVNVSNGVLNVNYLGAGNTTPGETWRCGITPIDQSTSGLQVNSSAVTIYTNRPPVINQVQCLKNNTFWTNCSALNFSSNFSGVRVNCTSESNRVANITVNLTNVPDAYTYFSNSTSDNSSGLWAFYYNVTMNNSGMYILNITCFDNTSLSSFNYTNWSLPWGHLAATLVNPTSNTNVQTNDYFNFTASVTCVGGECGNINATLDPATTWWNYTYLKRKLINITNTDSSALPQNYSIMITTDTTTSDFLTNGSDVRIVYWNGTAYRELDRYNETPFHNASTKIWFRLQNNIASGSYDDNYYMYYNNSAASNPPNNGSKVFEFFEDFNRTDNETIGNGWTETSGLWNISGNRVLNRNNADSDLTRIMTTNNHSIRAIANHNTTNADWKLVGRTGSGTTYGYAYGYQNDQMQIGTGTHDTASLGTVAYTPTAGENHELELNMYGSRILAYRDGTLIFNVSDATYTNGNMTLHAWDFAAFDDVWVRKFTLNEPTTALSSAESYYSNKGAISTAIGDVPFYTINPNPYNYSNLSCLGNLSDGAGACNVTWTVNATGRINSTHTFWVNFNMTSNQAYVGDNSTTRINITITDATLVPPTTTLVSPANNNITNLSAVTFNCSATDNSGLANMTLYGNFTGAFLANGTNVLRGTSNSTTFARTLNDGKYLWNCLANDTDGNQDWGNSNFTLTVDTTKPIINLSAPANGDAFALASLKFNFTVTDNLASSLTCNLTIDSQVRDPNFAATNGANTSRTIGGLSQGDHYWNVTCWDSAYNTNTSATWNFTISDLPPNVTLVTPDNYSQNSSTINLQYNATDNNGVTLATLYINGSAYDNTTSVNNGSNTFTENGLGEGRYNWTVNVSDSSNLTSQATWRWFIIDSTKPRINLTYPDQTFNTNLSNITFNFTATDNLDYTLNCNLTLNGTVVDINFTAQNNSPISRPRNNLADGVYYWNVTCWDDAYNTNTSETRMLNISSPPTVNLTSPADNKSQNNGTVIFYYLPADNTNLSSCVLIINNQANRTNTTIYNGISNNFTVTNLGSGEYNWTVNCTDLGGLTTQASPQRRLYIDVAAPNITLAYPTPALTIYSRLVNFNFTVIDDMDQYLNCNLTIDSAVNQTNFTAQNSSYTNITVTIGMDGPHYWNVTCWDDAGNTNTSATWNFTTNNPPTVVLYSPASGAIVASNPVTFDFTPFDTDGLRNTTLLINGAIYDFNLTPDNGNHNYYYETLADGVYNWTVNATDMNNLTGGATPQNFTLDTTPPNVTINTPYNNQNLTNNNVTFMFNVTDNLASNLTCNLTVNGSVVWNNISANNRSNVSRSQLMHDGNYNWSATCWDNANNTNAYNLINFTVEAPPNITLNFPYNGYRTNNQNITFNYTPADGYGIANCSLFIDGVQDSYSLLISNNYPNYLNPLSNISEGEHNWSIYCYDNPPDSNSAMSSYRNFTIDISPPVINLTYPGPGSYINNNNVTFNWTATDYPGTTVICNLTVDGVINQTGINKTSGSAFNVTLLNMSSTIHYWNVTCADDLNTSNTSETRNFTVNQPDLYIDSSRISFNNTNPDLYQNITIRVNVSNIGGVPANNVLVDFWDNGMPDTGTYIGNFTATVSNNASLFFNTTWNITPGYHTIYVLVDPNNAIDELNETNNNATNNISALVSNITYPPNNTLTNNNTPMIIFNVTDYTSNNITYKIYVDGSFNSQTANVTSGTNTSINLNTLSDGIHLIKVQATDTLGRSKNSTMLNITIDTTAPTAHFITINGTWFNTSTPNLTFNITDSISANSNFNIYVNGTFDQSGSIANNTNTSIVLSGYPDSMYNITIQSTDQATNSRNNSIIIYIDTQQPNINLTSPNNTQLINNDTVIFNFTATDNLASYLMCNLTISNGMYAYNINATNGAYRNITKTGFVTGTYFWNVTCIDQANNTNISEPRQFTINPPDLYIDSSRISFNNTNPDLNQNITIRANISNIGGVDANNVLVDFWDNGMPDTGTYIGNFTADITHSGSALFNISWNITSGYHTIYVLVDPNNNITEMNESNNNATNNISALVSNITYPPNNTITNNNTPMIIFNVTDYTNNNITYKIYVDGSSNGQTANVTAGTNTTINLNTLTDGNHSIKVQATDTLGRSKNSSTLNITIDTQPPVVHFINQNLTWFNTSSPNIYFNLTDSFTSNINYSIYINSTFQKSSNSTNASQTNETLGPLGDSKYNITIQATDSVSNPANYTLVIYVDTTAPAINLTYPANDTNFTNTRNISLNFTATDNLASSFYCNLTLDGAVNRSNFVAQNATEINTSVSGLSEGTHYWNVSCIDNATNRNTSETRSFNIFIAPTVNLTSPANGNVSNNPNQTFYFNVSDETGLYNCSVLLNGAINNTIPASQLTNNAINNITVNYMNGTYNWSIRCFDNTTLHMQGDSTNWTITVDLDAPYPNITTANYTWFNTSSPNISFIITDNFASIINYTFYVNGTANVSGTARNNTANATNLQGLNANASFSIVLQATDNATNSRNSSSIIIYVDTVAPAINLSAPGNGEEINSTSVTFNFTATDNMAPYAMCNLTVSNGMNSTNINATSNVLQNLTLNGFASGTYFWNVSCIDLAANRNTSTTLNFTIRAPDLVITSGNISFNDSSPQEGQNITLYANIYNNGGIGANNFVVQFWKGDPAAGGTQINSNQTIATMATGSNVTINTTYNTTIGNNNIFVVVDPNSIIPELNETNNKDNNSINVSLYQTYAGNVSGLIDLEKQTINKSLYQWNVSNYTGSNIFVTDIRATPNFNSLQAIGINNTNGTTSNDFTDIDTALNSTNLSDSVNKTFTINGNPKATTSLTFFTNIVNNIPIINSTNVSSFVTGILWDTSDGNTEYNGTQDLLFVTTINQSQQGSNGIYDFEIKVPAFLRNYKGPGSSVAFYSELK